MSNEIDPEKEYNKFWKPIVENEDGSINMEQLKKELADFSWLISSISQTYCHISGNSISNPLTLPYELCVAHDNEVSRAVEEEIADFAEMFGIDMVCPECKEKVGYYENYEVVENQMYHKKCYLEEIFDI